MSFDGARRSRPSAWTARRPRSTTSWGRRASTARTSRVTRRSHTPAYTRGSTCSPGAGRRDEVRVSRAPAPTRRNVRVSYGGAEGLSLDADGALHVATPLGDLGGGGPVLYQTVDGNRVAVAGQFVLLDADTYGFAVTGRTTARANWSSIRIGVGHLPGGSGTISAEGIAVDGAGNAYVTGYTWSAGWATPGARHHLQRWNRCLRSQTQRFGLVPALRHLPGGERLHECGYGHRGRWRGQRVCDGVDRFCRLGDSRARTTALLVI